jgi:membrane protein required for colicin V production
VWYDILVVCILFYFLAKGAARGLIWQLAGIAGILLCVTFAGTASKLIGPHINLAPPANQWAVMFITYLLASFVAFGFARTLNQWIEKLELKEYNRHLGAIFGLVKGALLVLIMTFMIVTFSEKSRGLVKESKAANIAAKVIHQIGPILPDKLDAAVARYIDMFERTGFGAGAMADEGEEILPEAGEELLPDDGTELGQTAPFNPNDLLDRSNRGQTAPAEAVDLPPDLLTELHRTFGPTVTQMVEEQMRNASPRIRERIEQSVTDALQSADSRTKRQLQNQVSQEGTPDNLIQLLDGWASDYLANIEGLPPGRTAPAATPKTQPKTAPASRSGTVAKPPAARQPASNPPETQPAGQRTILDEIVAAKSQFPSIQKKLKAEYQQMLRELPQQVGQAVFQDWYGDLTNSSTDVDPDTNASTPIEARIKRQLKAANYPETKLPAAMQQRLEDFGMTAEGAGVFR